MRSPSTCSMDVPFRDGGPRCEAPYRVQPEGNGHVPGTSCRRRPVGRYLSQPLGDHRSLERFLNDGVDASIVETTKGTRPSV